MTGIVGVEPHMFPTKKGTSIGKAPKRKNTAAESGGWLTPQALDIPLGAERPRKSCPGFSSPGRPFRAHALSFGWGAPHSPF